MKVILTEKVRALGDVGEIVNVRPGLARNFLIPQGKAIFADERHKAQIGHINKMLERKVAQAESAAQAIKTKLEGLTLELTRKGGAPGKLFGAVTTTDLAYELEKKGIDVERRLLVLERPIKAPGNYHVKAKLFKGVEAHFTVKVEMEFIATQDKVEKKKEKQKEDPEKQDEKRPSGPPKDA